MKGVVLCVLLALSYASAEECTIGALKGNLYDCKTFYECIGNKWALLHCSPGLEWNEAAKACDWPSSAQCKETSAPPTEPTTEGTTGEPTVETTEGTSGTTASGECICPAQDDPQHDVLCRNPEDCGSFFKCFKGNPSLIKCPPGQEWANELQRCDWPSIANCHEDSKH